MVNHKSKTGYGPYITSLVVDSGLKATEARLFAFIQLHVDYRTGIFSLKRKTTCAKLGIDCSTYTRALRKLAAKHLIFIKHRFRGGQQITSHIVPCMEGFKLRFPRYLISSLRDTAFLVYVELLNRCGQDAWSLNRKVLADKFSCSLITISRAIRELRERNLIDAVPDYDRKGINRFRILTLHERVLRLKRLQCRRMLLFHNLHKLVFQRKRQRTALLRRHYARLFSTLPLSSMHLLFPIPRCIISKERKNNKIILLAISNPLIGISKIKIVRGKSPPTVVNLTEILSKCNPAVALSLLNRKANFLDFAHDMYYNSSAKEVINMDTNMTFRMDSEVKAQMSAICNQLGMTTSTAFNIFANAFVRAKGMPFAVTIAEEPAKISHEKMLEDTDQLLAEFASDYKRMAE